MKRIQQILPLLLLLLTSLASAQSLPAKATTGDPGAFPEVSFMKSKIAENPMPRGEDILWKRDVYRIVNLLDRVNGSLYFPVEPTPDRQNLFCTIFSLVASGRLTAYEFNDTKEVFTPDKAIDLKVLLKKYEIPFKEKPDPKKSGAFIFDIYTDDYPSSDVTTFYVKEVYYLDQRNSTMHTRTLAICPVLIRADETGETRKHAMFWIPFDNIKNYLSQIPVSADTVNGASRMNAYDFFNQHRFKGEIYKVSNLRNQSLYDYCKSPEEFAKEQERLEKELISVNDKLWEPSQRDKLEADKQKADAEKNAAKKARENKPKTQAVKSKSNQNPQETIVPQIPVLKKP